MVEFKDVKSGIGMVEQNYTNFSSIINVNDSGHDVNFMSEGKAQIGCNLAISTRGKLYLDIGRNERLIVGRYVKTDRYL
jgi:hypothetical protein